MIDLKDEIAAIGRKIATEENVKEVDIRISLRNGTKILWDSYNDNQKY